MADEIGTYGEQFGEPFQKHILAVAARIPGFIIRYRTALSHTYFVNKTYRTIAQTLLEHVDQHQKLPTRVTLFEEAKAVSDDDDKTETKVQKSVDALYDEDISDANAVMQKTIEFGKLQAMVNAVLTGAEEIQKGNRNILPLIHEATLVGEDILNVGLDFKEGMVDRLLAYLSQEEETMDVIPTGIDHLDYALGGGVSRGELAVVLAPPKKGKCVDPDTRVWTPAHGYISMREVCDAKPEVYGIDETTNRARTADVVGACKDGRKRIAEITLRSGRKVFGFAETHPVLTHRGWVPTKDLRIGDYVVGASQLPLSGTCDDLFVRECWLHGVMCGDGGLTDRSPNLFLHRVDDVDILQRVRDEWPEFVGSTFVQEPNCLRVGLSRIYFKFLERVGGKRVKSPKKFIPRGVWEGGTRAVGSFLAGLFDTDGSAYYIHGRPVVEFGLSSERLANDVLTALNVFGVYATIHQKTVANAYTAWVVRICDGEGASTFGRELSRYGAHKRKWSIVAAAASGRGQFYSRLPYTVWERVLAAYEDGDRWTPDNMAQLARVVGLKSPRRFSERVRRAIHRRSRVSVDVATRIGDAIGDKWISSAASGDYVFDEVVSVGWVKKGPTLDIEVEDSAHTFLAEGLFTHNTTTLVNIGFGGLTSVLGFNVVHYTLEMSEKKVMARYDDRVAGSAIKNKKFAPDKFVATLKKRITKFIRGRLFVKGYPTRSATPTMIRTHLSLLASRGFVPDLVIVDYADIMKAERRLGEMRHEQAGLYEDLRQIAGEFNVAMWTASQAPKGTLDKESLTLADFAEAFEKAAIIDACVAFCQSANEKVEGTCRLVLAGLRNQEDGRVVQCRIQRDRCNISSLSLTDGSYLPVHTPYDDDDDDEDGTTKKPVKNTVTVHQAKMNIKEMMKEKEKKTGGKKLKITKQVK